MQAKNKCTDNTKKTVSPEAFKMPAQLARKVSGAIILLVTVLLIFLGIFTAVTVWYVKNYG